MWYTQSDHGYVIWPQFLSPYYREEKILDEGLTSAQQKLDTGWLADYALCAWGPGGDGSANRPYWRWPGSLFTDKDMIRPMMMAEVRRPAETMQFSDGATNRYDTNIRARHRNGMRNGAFLDGHARVITETEWNRLGQDEKGYFYRIAAADR
jgi:prepilin-type processing-associated H-X9-DG protein